MSGNRRIPSALVWHLSVLTAVSWTLVACNSPSSLSVSVAGEDAAFDSAFGSILLDRILSGKAVKVSLETDRKLSFEQDAGCSSCGGVNGNNQQQTTCDTMGCSCRVNGANCSGNLVCSNNVCLCPSNFLNTTKGCIPPCYISIPPSTVPFGFTTCNPPNGADIPNLIIGGPRPVSCTTTVLSSTTEPINVPAYDTSSNYISINPQTGQAFFNAFSNTAPPLTAPEQPCGPTSGNNYDYNVEVGGVFLEEPLVQSYSVQCVDGSGIVCSNTLAFNVSFPSCQIVQACAADGTDTNPSSPPFTG